MVNINTVWTEDLEKLALESLAGGVSKAIRISELATQDIVGVWVVYNEHPSATAGLRVKVLARTNLTGLGTQGVAYGDGIQFDIDELGTRLETTVDANSSGTTLNLAATANADLGTPILIDAGDSNSEEELTLIEAITAGVSVTVFDTLVNDPTGANASTVEEVIIRYVPLYGMPDAVIMLENLDGSNACEIAVFAASRDWTSV